MSTKSFNEARARASLLPTTDKNTVAFTEDEHFSNVPDIVQGQYEDTLIQASAKKTWLGYSLANQYEVAQGDVDEDFQVKPEQLQTYRDQGYSDRELELLGAAHSADNFQVRLNRIAADRAVDKQLGEAGGWGIVAQLGTGFADPALIPAMLLSGGAAATSKLSTVKAVGVSMLEGAAVNGALEYYMAQGDTQRDTQDVMLALAAGASLSGLFTAGARSYSKYVGDMEDARTVDVDHNNAVEGMMVNKELNDVGAALEHGMPDAAQRRRFTTEQDIMDELQAEVIARETGDRLSPKKAKALKQEFREYRKAQKTRQAKISASNMRPSAKNKQINQLQDAIDRREAKLNETLAISQEASTARSELDALSQGSVPDTLKSRYAELKAELGEADLGIKLDSDVGKSIKAQADAEMDKMPDVEVETEKPGNVGAAKTDQLTLKYEMYGNLLPELDEGSVSTAIEGMEQLAERIPRITRMATGAPVLRSMSSKIDTSMISAIRGLGAALFPNGVRTVKGHQSAVETANAVFHRGMQHVNEYNVAKEAWLQKQGISWYDYAKQAEASREFDKATAIAQITGQGDELVLEAAKSKIALNKFSLETNKAYKVHGFENVNHSDDYISIVYDYDNIQDLVANKGNRAEEVVATISKAYQTGGIRIEPQYADTLAKAQVERAARTYSGTNQAYRFGVTETDFKHVEKYLLDEGMDAVAVKELRESIFTEDLKANRSPRAMHSLKPNVLARVGNVSMSDIIDTSIDRNIKYLRETSGNAGLYSVGIQGRKNLEQILDEVTKRGQNQIVAEMSQYPTGSKAHTNLAKELEKVKRNTYRDDIDGGVSLMFGESLDTYNDATGDALRQFKKGTSILRLRATGLTTIPEWAYAMVRNGGIRTLKAAFGSRFMDLRKGSIAKDEFMKDFSSAFGATGHQEYLFGRYAYNGSDFDDVTKTRLGKIMDKFLDKGMNATMTANLFRTFQHGGEETVARSIVSGLRESAISGKSNKVVESLQSVGGLSAEEVSDISNTLKKAPDIFDGVKLLDPQLQNKLASAVQTQIAASFMRMRVGEASMITNQEMGKVFTHLLTFAMGSYEKQLVRGLKHEKAALISVLTSQMALGTLAHSAYVYQRAAAMDGDKRSQYIEKNMSEEGIFWGMMNKVGLLAAPMTMLQILATFGLTPEAITGSPTKAGVSSFSGVPVVGMAGDVARGGRSLSGQASDLINNTDDTDNTEAARNIRMLVPLIDTPLWNLTAGQVLAED